MIKNNETKRCVIYAKGKTRKNLNEQLECCEKYISANGYACVGEYIDTGVIHSTSNTYMFEKMLADSQMKKYDVVISYNADRFYHNNLEKIMFMAKLVCAGLDFYDVTENSR